MKSYDDADNEISMQRAIRELIEWARRNAAALGER